MLLPKFSEALPEFCSREKREEVGEFPVVKDVGEKPGSQEEVQNKHGPVGLAPLHQHPQTQDQHPRRNRVDEQEEALQRARRPQGKLGQIY